MHTTGNTPSKSSYFLTIDWPWGLWGGGSWWGTPASAPPGRARRWGRGSGRSRPRWPRSCPCRGRPAAPPLNRSRWTSWKAAGGNWEFIFFVNRRLFLVEFCECLLAQAQHIGFCQLLLLYYTVWRSSNNSWMHDSAAILGQSRLITMITVHFGRGLNCSLALRPFYSFCRSQSILKELGRRYYNCLKFADRIIWSA